MKYGVLLDIATDNIGDDIQSYAAYRFLPKVDYIIDREKMDMFGLDDKEVYEPVSVIMNAWYMYNKSNWPPSAKINPLFVAMHITGDDRYGIGDLFLEGMGGDYLKHNSPIGARDESTLKLLKRKGIDAYFSGCLTLTLDLPEKKPKTDEVILVDVDDEICEALEGNYPQINWVRVTHKVDPMVWRTLSMEERFLAVEKKLYRYQQANCVITSRLHCALPCLALETPVLLLYREGCLDRMGAFLPLLHCMSANDVKDGKILFDVANPPKNKDSYKEYRKNLIERCKCFINDSENGKYLSPYITEESQRIRWQKELLYQGYSRMLQGGLVYEDIDNYLTRRVEINNVIEDDPYRSIQVFISVCCQLGGIYYGEKNCFGDEEENCFLLISRELDMTGASIVLMEMANALQKMNYKVLYMSQLDGPLKEDLICNGVSVLVMPFLHQLDIFAHITGLFKMVVINSACMAPIGAVLNGFRIPVLWWLHESKSFYEQEIVKSMPRWLFPNIKVVVEGKCAGDAVSGYRPDYKYEDLSYFLTDTCEENDDNMNRLATDNDNRKVFALVGSIESRKGHDIFFDAFNSLSKDVRDRCKILLVGKPKETGFDKLLDRMLELHPGHIEYIPQLNRTEMRKIYRNVDCVVSASREDSMPLIIAEACQFSKTVICSDGSDFSSLLIENKAGLVFDGEKADELADCICKVCNENGNEFKDMRENARRLYESYFTEESFISKMRDCIFPEALGNYQNDNTKLGQVAEIFKKINGELYAQDLKITQLLTELNNKKGHIDQLVRSERELCGEVGNKTAHVEQLLQSERELKEKLAEKDKEIARLRKRGITQIMRNNLEKGIMLFRRKDK
ncbi:MAG: glycosyltransferase [Lachnospiraceae bacterium]|jgi:glycosyltransferase involved in cell wall biosynthesis|nr:glycosyltransferase [Lachnospiraceae bacterium]